MQIYKFIFIRLRFSIAGNRIQRNLDYNPAPLPLTHSLLGRRAAKSTSPVAFSAHFLLIFSLRAGTLGLFWALTHCREPEKITLVQGESLFVEKWKSLFESKDCIIYFVSSLAATDEQGISRGWDIGQLGWFRVCLMRSGAQTATTFQCNLVVWVL